MPTIHLSSTRLGLCTNLGQGSDGFATAGVWFALKSGLAGCVGRDMDVSWSADGGKLASNPKRINRPWQRPGTVSSTGNMAPRAKTNFQLSPDQRSGCLRARAGAARPSHPFAGKPRLLSRPVRPDMSLRPMAALAAQRKMPWAAKCSLTPANARKPALLLRVEAV